MKIRCPHCASSEIHDIERKKRLECENNHRFKAAEGLISFGDAVALASALTHPTRQAILLQFRRKSELSPNELAGLIDKGLSQVSYHVKVLRENAPPILIETRTQQVHGATEHFYRVNPSAVNAY